jgi:radical SAM protein with 4Fe4S-binding SPASM domain
MNSSVLEQGLSEIGIRLEKKGKRVPLFCQIAVTYRCNFNCVHCYCPRSDFKGELSVGKFKKIIDELADLGCVEVCFTGGEPFLKKGFLDLIKYTRAKGILVRIMSNGSLIDANLLKFLKKNPVMKFEVTLYGASKKTFEKMTQSKGGYEKVIGNIMRLKQIGVPLKLKSCITKLNIGEAGKMKAISDSLNLEFPFKIDPLVYPGHNKSEFGSGRFDCINYRISPGEYAKLDFLLVETPDTINLMLRNITRSDEFWRINFVDRFKKRYAKCNGGKSTLYIDPYGRVGPCTLLVIPEFDLNKHSLRKIWKELLPKELAADISKDKVPDKCKSCDYAIWCLSCPGRNLLETGDPDTTPGFICKIAKINSCLFDKKLSPKQRKQLKDAKNKFFLRYNKTGSSERTL